MKNNLLFLMLTTLFFACQNTIGPTVSMEGPSVDLMKKMVENYEKGDLDANLAYYADTAKIYGNGWGLPGIPVKEDMEISKRNLAPFSSYNISDELYEVVTVDGTDWIHFWGVWNGTLKADGSEVKMPFFMNPAVKDGKIIMQSFYSNAQIVIDAIEKANTPPIAEEVEEDPTE